LLRIENLAARDWYAKEAVEQRWRHLKPLLLPQ